MPRDRCNEQLRIHARILRRGDHIQRQLLCRHFPDRERPQQRLEIDIGHATFLAPLLHQDLIPGKERRERRFRPIRDAAVIFQRHLGLQICQMLHLDRAFVCPQHTDASGHRPVQQLRQLGQIRRAVFNFKIQDLAPALHADRQRQRDGHVSPRTEALRVPDQNVRAAEHALENAHQVEMREIDRVSGLFKQQPIHRISPPR